MASKHTSYPNSPTPKMARVILRPDGYVHIAFSSNTSILATRRAILELFADPIGFEEAMCTKYTETTNELCFIRRRHLSFADIAGLDLAYITETRQVVCDYPMLFALLSSNDGATDMDQPLNLKPLFTGDNGRVLSDKKALLLRYYLEVSSYLADMEPPTVERDAELRDDMKLAAIDAALHAFTAPRNRAASRNVVLDECLDSAKKMEAAPTPQKKEPVMLDVLSCAERKGYSKQSVLNKIHDGTIQATKDKYGHFLVDERELVKLPDKNKKSKKKLQEESLAGNYKEVQRIIKEHGYFTDAIAPLIMTQAEMEFFSEMHREVVIDKRPALIIDIHPEFVTSNLRTNRERILAGESPISPDSPTGAPFELHHIARRMNGPLAIVTTEDHDRLSKVLHLAPKDDAMDRVEFDMQRNSFYLSYLEMYDKGGYDAIPYLNCPRVTEPPSDKKKKGKQRKSK